MSNGPNSEASRTVVPHIYCRSCGSHLVQAADWRREDKSQWNVRLWCPECGFGQAALLGLPQVTYLSLAIEEGFACILEALAEFETLVSLDQIDLAAANLDLIKRARSERTEPTTR
ncbi:MAG: hypothetical protein V1912_04060 [bacterium]